ncbi:MULTISPECIES: OmpP1/FadL family transporter [unclassified Burkholderia]|uniref:OmpP1/FadL family transporter n=1 Tax=unclassified Burkholderia TaxID=2613784 RepID=UPI002AB1C6CB|nr:MULTISPECIES: outer membrane protein transport protein [unclassified Burkholderia]
MKMTIHRITLLCVLSAAAVSGSAWATNGSYLTGYGSYASGMGGVDIALPQDALVAADNPAGMAMVGNRFDVYGILLVTQSDSTFASYQNHFYSRAIVPALGLGFNYQISPQWTVGVSVTGVGISDNYGKSVLPVPGAGPAKSSLIGINTMPTVTYKPLPNLAVGVSLVLGLEQFRSNGAVGATHDGVPFALPSHGTRYAMGIGAGVGVLWTPIPLVDLGASYYTKTWFSALPGYRDDLLAASDGHLDGPSRYGVGIALHPLPKLTIAADYMRIQWSGASGYNIANSFNWHDQNVVRVGASYDISSKWTVRAGYSIANSHFDSDHTLANFYASGINDRAVTAGVTYSFDAKNSITAAVEYDIPRSVRGTGPSIGTSISTNFQVYTIGYTHKF